MSDKADNIGNISWVDLTVNNADDIRDFYSKVVGWKSDPVSMGGYSDYCMSPMPSGDPVAGICHARVTNADMPSQWLIYITVADLDRSISECESLGGTVISGPKEMGNSGRYCVIKDPAGAVAALFESKD